MFREQVFNGLSQGSLEVAGARMGARARVRAQASKTALRIRCKSSLEYLGTLVVVVEDFSLGDLLDCSKISDLGGGEGPKGATEEATERVTEGRFWR